MGGPSLSLADQIPKPPTLRDPESPATASRRAPTLKDLLVGDKFYGDDAFPGENEDPVQAVVQAGGRMRTWKDRRRPKKPHNNPQIVLFIHKISFMKFSNH